MAKPTPLPPKGTMRYGIEWPVGMNDLNIEFACFVMAHPDPGPKFGTRPEDHLRLTHLPYGEETPESTELLRVVRAQLAEYGDCKQAHFKRIVNALWNRKGSPKRFEFHSWAEEMLDKACREKYLGVAGCSSSGKCLAPHTKVLMFDGSVKTAAEVRTGDQLMGDDSVPRNVLGTSTGRSNMVRIVPIYGEPWECNDDHILTLRRKVAPRRNPNPPKFKRKDRRPDVIDISVKDYLALPESKRAAWRLFRVGVEYPEQPVPMDPWMYGLWVGDGTVGRPQVASSDREKDVNRRMKSFAKVHNYEVSKYVRKNTDCASYTFKKAGVRSSPFLKTVQASASTGEKRILREYLVNSRAVRLQVLAGLIDSDGCAKGPKFQITSVYKALAEDIMTLARSLGFIVSIYKEQFPNCARTKTITCYRINVSGNVEEIPTSRKKCRAKLQKSPTGTPFKVEQLGEGDWAGFKVDGNGRFLLGDFTVTHNSDFFAMWAIVNFICAPMYTLIAVVSTSLGEARRRIWGSARGFWQAVPGLPGKLVDSIGMIRFSDGTDNPKGQGTDKQAIHLVAGERKKEKDAVGKLIGMKNWRVFLIADEHTELSPAINEAAYGNLNSNRNFQFIGIANPASYYDAFGTFVEPKAGWASINQESDEWETKYGRCVRFDGMKSPNLLLGEDKYPWMITHAKLAEYKKNLGENSASFWRMVRGFWCPAGVEGTVFTETEIESYGGTKGVGPTDDMSWAGAPTAYSTLDPSFTNGGDESVAYFGKYGMTSQGRMVLLLTECIVLHEDLRMKDVPRSHQIIHQWKELCKERNVLPFNAGFDASGGGTPFGDVVAKEWDKQVRRIQFGGRATERPMSEYDDTPANKRCANRVTEIWHAGASMLRAGGLRGITVELARGLCERRVKTLKRDGNVVLVVEPKPEMKQRLGRSPDKEDAALMLVDMVREHGSKARRAKGSAFMSDNGSLETEWKKVARRYDSANWERTLTPVG